MMDTEKYQANAGTTAMLIEAGISLMRQNLKRRYPEKTEAQIDALLSAWLRRVDESMPGDTAGSVRVRERLP